MELKHNPELDARFPALVPAQVPASVALETDCGRFERLVEDPLGDRANPMDLAALVEKFRGLSAGRLTREKQDEMVAAILSLEEGGLPCVLAILGKSRQEQVNLEYNM